MKYIFVFLNVFFQFQNLTVTFKTRLSNRYKLLRKFNYQNGFSLFWIYAQLIKLLQGPGMSPVHKSIRLLNIPLEKSKDTSENWTHNLTKNGIFLRQNYSSSIPDDSLIATCGKMPKNLMSNRYFVS